MFTVPVLQNVLKKQMLDSMVAGAHSKETAKGLIMKVTLTLRISRDAFMFVLAFVAGMCRADEALLVCSSRQNAAILQAKL